MSSEFRRTVSHAEQAGFLAHPVLRVYRFSPKVRLLGSGPRRGQPSGHLGPVDRQATGTHITAIGVDVGSRGVRRSPSPSLGLVRPRGAGDVKMERGAGPGSVAQAFLGTPESQGCLWNP